MRRADVAVKWRFFRHLLGGSDNEAERVYRWHINERIGPRMRAGLPTDQWKTTTDDYVDSAKALLKSMQEFGFVAQGAIPIDRAGELLGGAHRLACAVALDMPFVRVLQRCTDVWAPPWHRGWFIEHGMGSVDLAQMDADWKMMHW